MKLTHHIVVCLCLAFVTLHSSCKNAQQPDQGTEVNSATAAVAGDFDRTILPILPKPFAGKLDTNAMQSLALIHIYKTWISAISD